MNPTSFLKEVNGLKGQGDGFRYDRDLPIRSAYLPSDGSALTTTLTTNPGFAVAETNAIILSWAATKVVPAGIMFNVPMCYDQAADEFRLLVIAQMGGATDTPVLTVAGFVKRAGAALAGLASQTGKTPSAGISPLTSAQSPALSPGATSKQILFDFSKQSLKPGDQLYFTITPAAHGTDALNLYQITARFRSCLAGYDETVR